jgi:hypothetical protein
MDLRLRPSVGLFNEGESQRVESVMLARCIVTIMGISASITAAAELRPEEAKYFMLLLSAA